MVLKFGNFGLQNRRVSSRRLGCPADGRQSHMNVGRLNTADKFSEETFLTSGVPLNSWLSSSYKRTSALRTIRACGVIHSLTPSELKCENWELSRTSTSGT